MADRQQNQDTSLELPIWVLEPELTEKITAYANKYSDISKRSQSTDETTTVNDIKQKLKKSRRESRDNIINLTAELQKTLEHKYPQTKVKNAPDSQEAVNYITGIAGDIRVVSVNNSSAVNREIQPGLEKSGFQVVNSYLHEYDVKERKIQDYWDLPRFLDKNLTGTFNITARFPDSNNTENIETLKYIAVLGVNAASAEDGTVFFLEHFRNIYTDLTRAQKIVLVVSLDKIVKTRQEAEFQTKCMGIFGMESVVLAVKPKLAGLRPISELGLPLGQGKQEIHVIILDNGRSRLVKDEEFEDLFLCIGCRACNKHCPIQRAFTDVNYIWSPRNYLEQFITGKSTTIDVCLHCEACRLECPVDIDLPHLMWQAKMEYVKKHGTSFSHKILGAPERLATLASPLAPVANRMMRIPLVRTLMEMITGIDRKTVLPVFHRSTFRNRDKKYGKKSGRK